MAPVEDAYRLHYIWGRKDCAGMLGEVGKGYSGAVWATRAALRLLASGRREKATSRT